MEVLIAGGSGYIGRHLARHLISLGHSVTVLGRSEGRIKWTFKDEPRIKILSWVALGLAENPLLPYDVVINLCGVNIGEKAWTPKRRRELIDSRVQPTKTLAELCIKAGKDAPRLFNASAIGVYGLQQNIKGGLPEPYTEDSPIDFSEAPDFLAKIGREWEQATQSATEAGVKVVLLRFGVVLSRDGGVLKKLRLPYRLGLGGRMDSGDQPFSWISMTDLVNAIAFLLDHPEVTGPVNIVSPHTVRQVEFAKAFGRAVKRPAWMVTPRWMVIMLFQQMGDELLLRGQHVTPKRLLDLGYQFLTPTMDSALGINSPS